MMAIIRFDPNRFDPFQMSRQFFQPFFEDMEEWPELTMTQGLNVYEENNKVVVEAAVPGIPEEKLEITYEDGVLHIRGKAEEVEEEKQKKRTVYRKQMVSSIDYTTYLPRPVDTNKIDASVKNGVLTLKAPIAPEAQPKRIPVKTVQK